MTPPPSPVELLHPPLDRPSGGNVYDRCLLEAAACAGFPLSSVVVAPGEVARRFDEDSEAFRVWDGLLLEEHACERRLERGRWGVLLHWLPSQDPALDESARETLESIERGIVEASSLVLVPSASLQRRLRQRHPAAAIAVCEPGVRDDFRRPVGGTAVRASDCVELLTVANLVPAKGLVELLPLLASLRELRWRWHVVGDRGVDPDCTRRFDETAVALGLSPRIVHHGALDARAIVERMDLADVFVFPSRFESYGMVLAEAAARALPVLAYRVGAAGRLFENGSGAMLVPVGDAGSFAGALRRMIVDASLRSRFRERLSSRAPARGWEDTLVEFAAAVGGAERRANENCANEDRAIEDASAGLRAKNLRAPS